MARYNTGNPIDSAAMKDLSDNAQNLDVLVNSKTALTQTDRLGVERKTWHGMERDYDAAQSSRENQFQSAQSSREAAFSDFLQESGYQDLGEYAPGIEITAHNQYVTFGGQPYLLKPSISVPYTTSGVWTGDDFKLIGDDSLRQDLANPSMGPGIVGFDKSIYYPNQTIGGAIRNALSGTEYVESFRTPGLSDSNTIRSALDYIESNRAGNTTVLVFEASREYVYDRTAELRTINNLLINLNGATLRRAPATATRAFLAQDAGTGQSSIYVDAIPENWEVGDYLSAYVDNTDAGTSKNTCLITAIVRAENRVVISGGFGNFGGYTALIPSGTTVAKKFGAFIGRPSSTESYVPTPGGVNYNVHIVGPGIIDGNAAQQENNSWYFNNEIVLHGRSSSVVGISFERIAGECIVGHGLRVENNSFRQLQGSAFHTSMHDDSWSNSSASWFVGNFVDGVCLATQAVGGHTEGAVTFSWGAGRLIITGNEFANGAESVMGSFHPDATNTDRWLIFSNNICRSFNRLFYSLGDGVEGVVVADNILIDCESSLFQMVKLLNGATNIVGGNSCIGTSRVIGAHRATNAVYGAVGRTIQQVALIAGNDVGGFNIERISGNRAAITDPSDAMMALCTGDAGRAGFEFFTPSGTNAGEFFAQWKPSAKTFELLGNANGPTVRVAVKSATLNLDHTQTHADNAAALAAGMVKGDVYATPTGQLMRVFTP